MIQTWKNDNRIFIKFFFKEKDKFYKTLEQIKGIPGRQFHNTLKSWSIPINNTTMELLQSIEGINLEKETKEKKLIPLLDLKLPELKFPKHLEELFPHQKEDVKIMNHLKGNVLNANEMGLGKTAETSAFLWFNPKLRPALLVVPATLKIKWQRELKKWAQEDSEIIYGQEPSEVLPTSDIIIINYDIIFHHYSWLKDYGFKFIGADESHYLKNDQKKREKKTGKLIYQTQRTGAVKRLSRKAKSKMLLSGTPIESKPIDLFSQLNIVDRDSWPSRFEFAKRYCDMKHNGFGWDYSGSSNTKELNEILKSTMMIRRKKKDTLNLPEKLVDVLPLEISNRKEYDLAEESFLFWLEEQDIDIENIKAENLVKFEKLKQLAVEGKMDFAIRWIQDFLETEKKLVVVCTHQKTVDLILKKFPKISVRIDGRDTTVQKQKAVDEFQNNEKIKLVVGNIKSIGEGHDLTAATDLVFLEIGQTAGKHSQAEDRIHRIGQAGVANIWYLVGLDTVEEKLAEIIDRGQIASDEIIDGEETDEKDLIVSLIKEIKEAA